ncbi:MAG: PAS domain-containing protein, partial [Bacteroidales bacterium]
NNIETDDKMLPWRENAIRHGFRSSITEPILIDGEVIGAYTMYSDESGFFNQEEIELLDELASNISFALEFIESENKRKQAEEELKENNQRLIDAQAVAKVGSWETDLSNMSIKWSIETFRIFELDPNNFQTSHPNIMDYVHPEDRLKLDEVFFASLNKNSLKSIQHRIITQSGIVKFVEENWRIIYNDQGQAIRAFGTCSDITERKLAEEKLRKKDIEFRKLSANLPDLIFQFTRKPDGTYFVPIASEGIKNIFGCSPEDVLNDFTPIGKVIHPADAARVIADIEYSAEHLIYFTCEFRVQIPGKEIQWILSRSTPEKLPDGSVTWYGFNADITERKKAEEDLEQLSTRFSLAVRAGGVGVWDYDIVNNTLLWDDQMFVLYGINKNDFGGAYEAWRSGLHPEDTSRGDAEIQMAMRGEKEFDTEFRVVWHDGSIHNIRAIASIQRNNDGQAVRMIGTNWDITEQKKIEQELTIAKEKAEESDRLKSAFLANMSHEIRTPMNGILGFAELLKEPGLTGEQQQEYIRIIEKSGTRMLNIINDIVSISKIESGTMEVSYKESDINLQIGYIYDFFKPEFEAKGLKFSFKNSLPAKFAIVKTDREKLYAILTNLVKNAVKYTNEGSVEFGYNLKSANENFEPEEIVELEFYVKDTGIGIIKDRQEAIFERFIQADIAD